MGIERRGSSGGVAGAASSTDNAVARFDGTDGKRLQNSLVTVTDTGNIDMPAIARVYWDLTNNGNGVGYSNGVGFFIADGATANLTIGMQSLTGNRQIDAPDVAGTFVVVTSGNVITLPNGVKIASGAGTPEGVVTAPVGSTYHRTNGGAGTSFYVKESGSGNTGWVAK